MDVVSIGTAVRRRYGLAPLVVDRLLALALTVLLVVEAGAGDDRWQHLNAAAVLMTIPLAWRRRQPLLVFGLVMMGAVVAIGPVRYVGFVAIMIAAYSVGAYGRSRLLSLGILALTATAILAVFGGVLPPIPDVAGPYLVLLPLWLVGDALRAWRVRATASEDRATRLEREQEQATRAAVAAEQARIARELHDVVAHNVSVMVVQAGAARHILPAAPERAAEALLAVEASGREAMTELRRLLGLLSHDDEDLALAPQPGIERLAALVRRVCDAGLPVELRVEGQPRPLPAGLNLAAYRIVQEALTNALKYAGGARTEVVLAYREDALKVEVLDEGIDVPMRASEMAQGHGLVGMRERVSLYGGRLEAGSRLERGYAVRAWLPLRDAPVASGDQPPAAG